MNVACYNYHTCMTKSWNQVGKFWHISAVQCTYPWISCLMLFCSIHRTYSQTMVDVPMKGFFFNREGTDLFASIVSIFGGDSQRKKVWYMICSIAVIIKFMLSFVPQSIITLNTYSNFIQHNLVLVNFFLLRIEQSFC